MNPPASFKIKAASKSTLRKKTQCTEKTKREEGLEPPKNRYLLFIARMLNIAIDILALLTAGDRRSRWATPAYKPVYFYLNLG